MPYNIVYRFGKFYVIDALTGEEVNNRPPNRKILTGANDVADFMGSIWRAAGEQMPEETYNRWFATAMKAQKQPGVETPIVAAANEPAPTSPPPPEQTVRLKEYDDLKARMARIDRYIVGLEEMKRVFVEAGGDTMSGLYRSLEREEAEVMAERSRIADRMAVLEKQYHTNVQRLF